MLTHTDTPTKALRKAYLSGGLVIKLRKCLKSVTLEAYLLPSIQVLLNL